MGLSIVYFKSFSAVLQCWQNLTLAQTSPSVQEGFCWVSFALRLNSFMDTKRTIFFVNTSHPFEYQRCVSVCSISKYRWMEKSLAKQRWWDAITQIRLPRDRLYVRWNIWCWPFVTTAIFILLPRQKNIWESRIRSYDQNLLF